MIIAGAWEPFVGSGVAEERARNAVLLLNSYPKNTRTPETIRQVLTHTIVQARLEQYGSIELSGSMVADAVEAAAEAIEAYEEEEDTPVEKRPAAVSFEREGDDGDRDRED